MPTWIMSSFLPCSDTKLGERHGALLGERTIGGLDQRHGLDVVGAGKLRLGAGLDRVLQLLHDPLEGLREPARGPARVLPRAAGGLAAIAQGARAAFGIVGPADGALGEALRPLDAPADIDVGLEALLARARPHILEA